MAESVQIQTMGDFLITADGVTHEGLAAKSRKGISLMQYLMLQEGRPVSSQRLIRELWAGSRIESPENALKTMVSRSRALLNGISPGLGESIASGQGHYRWQTLPNVSADVLDIMAIYKRLHDQPAPEERAALTERLLKIYQGDLFQTGDINNGVTLANWLHREYLEAVYAYIQLLRDNEEFNRVCEVCRTALRVDDNDELLHIELVQAMAQLNRSGEAIQEYRRIERLARGPMADGQGEELRAACNSLYEASQSLRLNIDVIRNELASREGERKGPFFCEYEAFKEIYNIQMRNLERLGSTMFLGVMMVGRSPNELSPVTREAAMAALREVLTNNLRKGDIVTRFNDNMYAMLLPTVNYATGGMVMERINQVFYAEFPSDRVSLYSRVSPLGGAR